jgi:hypothetical protein
MGELYMISLILVGLTLLYWLQLDRVKTIVPPRRSEAFMDYIVALEGPDSFLPQAGTITAGDQVALGDFIPVKTGLTKMSAISCAAADQARQGEVGGQYTQRTNNYRHDYPDSCTAPLSEFVGSVYGPKKAVGANVPCDGEC